MKTILVIARRLFACIRQLRDLLGDEVGESPDLVVTSWHILKTPVWPSLIRRSVEFWSRRRYASEMHPNVPAWRTGTLAMFCLGLLLARSPVAAATAGQDPGPPTFSIATNIQQLRQLARSGRRALCSLELEGVVCSVDSPAGGLILQDDSGAELLEMDFGGYQLASGDRVKLGAEHCSVAVEGAGLAIGKAAVVDNDGIHPMLQRNGSVYLSAGRHPLRLEWFNSRGRFGLNVSFQGPGLEIQKIPDSALFRTESDATHGLDYRCYEGPWINLYSGFGRGKVAKAGYTTNFDLGVRTRDDDVGLVFNGYFEAPREGLYKFTTESDDGSLLFVGEPAPMLERLGAASPPVARRLMIAQILREEEEGQWTEVEGTLEFASETASGIDLELRTEAGRMELVVADRSGLSPTRLLHRRIRAAGVARGASSLDGPRVLGFLSVLSGADISSTEAAPAGSRKLPLLTTGAEVKDLQREEAERGYPVRIRGVVTRAVRGHNSIVIQDATRGVFVKGLPARDPGFPQRGESWEIEGTTAPGDFAPVVVWRQGRRLGAGLLPDPVTATWDQLMSGNLDTQYVQIEGIATEVKSNRLELLLPEGKINLGFLDLESGSLNRFDNALIQVRGCLFPAWDPPTHRLIPGEVNIASAVLTVEDPAPPDLFSTPARQLPDLFLYDPGGGPFRRVKVAGQFLGSRQGQCFLTDGTNGLRFQARTTPDFQPGDVVEVVGFPELGGPSPILREAVARKTGHAELPQPRKLLAENWLDAGYDATLVCVDGLLVNSLTERGERSLELQSGLRTFVARLSGKEVLPDAPDLGSRIQLTGVYSAQGGSRAQGRGIESFELLLNSAADLRVLAQPPWLTLPRVALALLAVAVILLFALVWALSLRRQVSAQTAIIRHTAQREAALEERTRIAKDIHDDVGANLTSIMMLGERSRQDIAKPRELEVHTDKIVSYARATVQALDEIVWAINPQNDTLDALVGYLTQYASQFFESTNVRCRLDVPGKLSSLVLPTEVRHDLFLVVKEALNNILKHAQASEVTVVVAENDSALEISIEDNGRGFDTVAPVESARGDGLKNMRKRMTKITGNFVLTSTPGQGTKIRLSIPLNWNLEAVSNGPA